MPSALEAEELVAVAEEAGSAAAASGGETSVAAIATAVDPHIQREVRANHGFKDCFAGCRRGMGVPGPGRARHEFAS
eukprot:365980-Chlamydomonas_euryale.AAC.7